MSPSVTPPLTAAPLMEKAGPAYISDMVQLTQQLNTMLQMQRCVAYQSMPQVITSGVFTPLTFDLEVLDIGGIHESVTHPTRFTAQNTGFYQAVGNLEIAANAGGAFRLLSINVNGAQPTPLFAVTGYPNAGTFPYTQVVGFFQLTAGDYIEFVVYQDSGAGLATTTQSTIGSLVLLSRL